MEHSVLVRFLAFVSTAFIISDIQAYQPVKPLYEKLQSRVARSGYNQASLLLRTRKASNRLSDIDMSLLKQNAELEAMKHTVDNLASSVSDSIVEQPLTSVLTVKAVHEALRQALLDTGLSNEEVDELFESELNKIQNRVNSYGKRDWNKLSVQTRFAPFGTKLVPNRKLENGGATLLRYGRSLQQRQSF
uniref:Uncharacterized protein n=1 Tax=Arion vulgaris TaxID=1028688 RepID=A0A0B6ZRQ7_9EUPU